MGTPAAASSCGTDVRTVSTTLPPATRLATTRIRCSAIDGPASQSSRREHSARNRPVSRRQRTRPPRLRRRAQQPHESTTGPSAWVAQAFGQAATTPRARETKTDRPCARSTTVSPAAAIHRRLLRREAHPRRRTGDRSVPEGGAVPDRWRGEASRSSSRSVNAFRSAAVDAYVSRSLSLSTGGRPALCLHSCLNAKGSQCQIQVQQGALHAPRYAGEIARTGSANGVAHARAPQPKPKRARATRALWGWILK